MPYRNLYDMLVDDESYVRSAHEICVGVLGINAHFRVGHRSVRSRWYRLSVSFFLIYSRSSPLG